MRFLPDGGNRTLIAGSAGLEVQDRRLSVYCLGVVEGWLGGVPVLLSGAELEPELGGVCIESDELAGGVDVSEGGVLVLGGELDCIELSELGGAAVSEPVACCREQAAASVSALRHKSNKPRFIGHLAIMGSLISRPHCHPGVPEQRIKGPGVPLRENRAELPG
jgi:hypothetical protein